MEVVGTITKADGISLQICDSITDTVDRGPGVIQAADRAKVLIHPDRTFEGKDVQLVKGDRFSGGADCRRYLQKGHGTVFNVDKRRLNASK